MIKLLLPKFYVIHYHSYSALHNLEKISINAKFVEITLRKLIDFLHFVYCYN